MNAEGKQRSVLSVAHKANSQVENKNMVRYSKEIAEEICERLAQGESLRAICADGHLPSEAAVRQWDMDNRDGFSTHYARARAIGYERLAEDIVEIADAPVGSLDNGATDSGAVNKQRLQIDSRKWLLSKMLPKKYGDKVTTEVTGADGGPVEISETDRAAKVAALLALAQSRRDTDVSDLV
jgi:hypothetical protein